MMAASTPGEDRWTEISGIPDSNEEQTGLVPGHAYSLISVHRTSTGARLLVWNFYFCFCFVSKSPLFVLCLIMFVLHSSLFDRFLMGLMFWA